MISYNNIHLGRFIERPNRFTAFVEMDGRKEKVHVKNTGRCRELLLPGAAVSVQHFADTKRKTDWDLIAVKKAGLGWVNIDSQVPNKVAEDWLCSGNSSFGKLDYIKPEFSFGTSRIDFYMEKGKEKFLMEVKGCTLEIGGMGFFPDAPTIRGARHLRELKEAVKQGYRACLLYCIAMNNVECVKANEVTDPDYAEAFREAVKAGVQVIYLPCRVTADSISFLSPHS